MSDITRLLNNASASNSENNAIDESTSVAQPMEPLRIKYNPIDDSLVIGTQSRDQWSPIKLFSLKPDSLEGCIFILSKISDILKNCINHGPDESNNLDYVYSNIDSHNYRLCVTARLKSRRDSTCSLSIEVWDEVGLGSSIIFNRTFENLFGENALKFNEYLRKEIHEIKDCGE